MCVRVCSERNFVVFFCLFVFNFYFIFEVGVQVL